MAKNRSGEPKKRKSRFGLFLLIYVWVLLILGGIGLYKLQDFLSAYEASQPKYFVEEYEGSLREAPSKAAVSALDDIDSRILSDEAKEAWLQQQLAEIQLSKDASLSREDHQVYRIRDAAGEQLGSVSFEPVAQGKYSLPVWGVTEEKFDFSASYRTEEITVPSDYSVFLGEYPLDKRCIAEKNIPYALLEECYLHYKDLPTMVRYETPPFVGEASLRVLDGEGKELRQEDLSEEAFLDRCSPEIREKAEEFIPKFIDLYVLYSADIEDSYRFYFYQLRPLVQPDSPLYTRLRMAFEGLGYTATKDVSLDQVDINRITDLGKDRYLVDVSYSTTVTGSEGPIPMEDHILLVLIDNDGTLLADALYYL